MHLIPVSLVSLKVGYIVVGVVGVHDWGERYMLMSRHPKRSIMRQACMIDLLDRTSNQREPTTTLEALNSIL